MNKYNRYMMIATFVASVGGSCNAYQLQETTASIDLLSQQTAQQQVFMSPESFSQMQGISTSLRNTFQKVTTLIINAIKNDQLNSKTYLNQKDMLKKEITTQLVQLSTISKSLSNSFKNESNKLFDTEEKIRTLATSIRAKLQDFSTLINNANKLTGKAHIGYAIKKMTLHNSITSQITTLQSFVDAKELATKYLNELNSLYQQEAMATANPTRAVPTK